MTYADLAAETRKEMYHAREDQEYLAYRAVESPEAFTAEKLSLMYLQRGYEYPMSADDIRRELARR